jgi:hypothetical protein
MRLLIVIGALATVALQPCGDAEAAATDDRRMTVASTGTVNRTNETQVVGGLVFHTQYSADGNNQDILQIDPATGQVITLVASASTTRFVAADERYVVHMGSGSVARPLVLVDRRSGATHRSVRLRDGVLAARIVENLLLVFQSREAIVFELPGLQIRRKVPFSRAGSRGLPRHIQSWGERFVAAGSELTVLDSELNVLLSVPVVGGPIRNNSSCEVFNLRVAKSLALVDPGCGLIRAYDLVTGTVRYEIDVGGVGPAFDVVDDVLFVADKPTDPRHRIRMFDLDTGRSLGRVSGAANLLVSRGHRLLALEDGLGYSEPTRLTAYVPDSQAIRDNTARRERLIQGCGDLAAEVARNPYGAIEACEAAGIADYLDESAVSPEVGAILERYAYWLAQTLSRYAEAIPILDKLEPKPPHAGVRATVRRKHEYLGPVSYGKGVRPEQSGVVKISLPFLSGDLTLLGARAYVSEWRCGSMVSKDPAGALLKVYDRTSMMLLKSVNVLPCDDEYQDSISSVAEVPGYLVLGLEYRYEELRPNVAVVKSSDTSLVGVIALPGGVESLSAWRGNVLQCGGPGEAMRLDLTTARLVDAKADEREACSNNDGDLRQLGRAGQDLSDSVIRTPHFTVASMPGRFDSPAFTVKSIQGGTDSYNVKFRSYGTWMPLSERDVVIVVERVDDYLRLSGVDLATRQFSILVEVKGPASWLLTQVWQHYLLMARGRDLMVYDIDRGHVIGYEKDLMSSGSEPVCSACNDGNRIAGLVLDGPRLIVRTLEGENSRLIDLPTFVASLGDRDLFAPE